MGSEQQAQMTVWCGGMNADQDVSIRLVPNGINQQEHQVTDLCSRESLAVLKVHSSRLKKHSKYFQACLSQRWTHPDANPSPPSMQFNLELGHGLQVASYTDCFSRMYTPLRKNFKDIKSTLQLLRVASQIEFHELVDTICLYLSTILWSEKDELRFRQFSSCPDFPRRQAEDLVARLRIGKHGNEDDSKKLICDQIAHSIRIALRQDGTWDKESFLGAQSLFDDLLCSIGESEIDSAFESEMVAIVSKEVKEMLESFHEDCRKQTIVHEPCGGLLVTFKLETVSGSKGKLKALCWALELLLKAQVAEEVIECLLHVELFFRIIVAVHYVKDTGEPASENVAHRFCKLVILFFQEVIAGRLLLGFPDRVLLIETWQWIDCIPHIGILLTGEFGIAVEGVFLTLPLQQQLELLQQNTLFSRRFICLKSFITLH